MTTPDHAPPQRQAIPGYFGPADPPQEQASPSQHQAFQDQHPQAQQVQDRQMPTPAAPYVAPGMSYVALDPASQPLIGATPLQAVGRFYKRYATFSGRASRSEFWWVQFFMAAVFLMTVVLYATSNGVAVTAYIVFWFASALPMFALISRRLHDINLHGVFTVFLLVPWVGVLIILGLACGSSNPRGSRFDRILPEHGQQLQARRSR